jgi:hypothetical protein
LRVSNTPLFEIFYLVWMEGVRVVLRGAGGLTTKAEETAKARRRSPSGMTNKISYGWRASMKRPAQRATGSA